jgi:hypothetical protein
MVTLVRLNLLEDLIKTGETLERGGVKLDPVGQVVNPGEAVMRVLEGDATNDAVHLITLLYKQFGEIRPILTRYACDESLSAGHCNS